MLLRLLDATLAKAGFEVTTAESAEDALADFHEGQYALVITDIRLPRMGGRELLAEVRRRDPSIQVILITAHGTIDDAVAMMRQGATDYVTKPLAPEDALVRVRKALRVRRLEQENRRLHEELATVYRPGRIVAESAVMREIVVAIERLALSDATVLITGESGTGKELLARALHYGGPRAKGPFVAVNCAAIPATLFESELFGHAKGAFTGAYKDQPGRMELAHGGTLLLDEVGELPLEMQPKLLRALQEKAIERVGEHKLRRFDVRFVSSTNRDLAELVKEGKFREDLYYRLAVVPVRVPPLRDRREDVPAIARHLLRQLAGDEAPLLTDDAAAELQSRPWPGNVRELANVLEHTLAISNDDPLEVSSLPPPGQIALHALSELSAPESGHLVELPEGGAGLDDMVRDLVVQALEKKNWNQSAAARLLRIPRHVLQYRVAKYHIRPESD